MLFVKLNGKLERFRNQFTNKKFLKDVKLLSYEKSTTKFLIRNIHLENISLDELLVGDIVHGKFERKFLTGVVKGVDNNSVTVLSNREEIVLKNVLNKITQL